MKWKKWFKKTVIALLAVLLTIPVLSDYSIVKAAGEDDYPDEILFPINVLDFRADNLLFEWAGGATGLDLWTDDLAARLGETVRGKGLVEAELDPETGLPVYKKEVVIYIAERVLNALGVNNEDVLDKQLNGQYNYLSLKRYLEKYPKWYFPDDASQVYGVMAGGAVRPNDANRVNNIGVAGGNDGTPGTVTFRFYSNAAKERCNLNISYATDEVRNFRILVNGEESIVPCPDNGSWTVPGNNPVSVEINVQEGWNEIQFGGNNAAAPNLCGFSVGDAEESICDVKIDESVEWTEQFAPYPVYAGVTNGAVANPNTGLVHEINAATNGTFSVWFFSGAESDNIAIYYASADGGRAFNVSVNGGAPVSTGGLYNGTWDVNNNAPYILENVNIKSGWNEIRFEGAGGRAPNLQGFAVNNAEFMVSDLIESAVWRSGYPLGDYDLSKEKFDNNPELGWTDITTCMDYAYFVTSNLFRYNESLNAENDFYENLVFHKVQDAETGKVAYEFAADSKHKNMDLVYNDVEKTVRNPEVDSAKEGDKRKAGGSLFLCDDMTSPYPDIDVFRGGDDGKQHNFHFTVSTKSKFVYKEGAGQYFYFSGDDDVYVFVNNRLLVDLGGAHQQLDGEFNLDDLATEHPELGLEDGKVVDFAFFYMERKTVASNFYGKMNFKLAQYGDVDFNFKDPAGDQYKAIPHGFDVDLNYAFTSTRELNTTKKLTFTDELGNTIGSKGFELGNGVELKLVEEKDGNGNTVTDGNGNPVYKYRLNVSVTNSQTFYLTEESGLTENELKEITDYFKELKETLGENFKVSVGTEEYNNYNELLEALESGKVNLSQGPDGKYELKVSVMKSNKDFYFDTGSGFSEDEIKMVTDYFDQLELVLRDTIEISGPKFDTSTKKYEEYKFETVSESGEQIGTFSFDINVDYESWMDGANVATLGNSKGECYLTVLFSSITVSTDENGNMKPYLSDYDFRITRDEDADETTYFSNEAADTTAKEYNINNIPIGNYTLTLDALPFYEVTVVGYEVDSETKNLIPAVKKDLETGKPKDGEPIKMERLDKDGNIIPDDDENTEVASVRFTLSFVAEYDVEKKTWSQPRVEFVLKAIGYALTDLT